MIFIGESIVTYFIGKKLTTKAFLPFFSAVFVLLYNLIPSINFTPHKPAVFLALLGFFLALNEMPFLSGLSLALSTFFQQNIGLLSATGVGFYLFSKRPFCLRPQVTHTDGNGKNKLDVPLLFISGYSLPIVIFLLYLLCTTTFKDAFYALAIWPFVGYIEFNKYPYFNCEIEIFKNTPIFSGGPLQVLSNFSGFVSLAFIGYFPFLIFPIFLYYSITNRDKRFYFCTICGLSLFLSSFTRPDFLHILYTLPLFFILFFSIFPLLRKKAEENIRARIPLKILQIFLILIIVMILFERTIFFLNVFTIPYEVLSTARGNVRVPYYTAQILRPLINFIDNNTDDNDKIFIYHWSPALYFYLKRNNPTQFDSYIPVYNTPKELTQIIEELFNNPPLLVIKDNYIERITNTSAPGSLSCSFPEAPRDKLKEDPIDRYIQENYKMIYESGFFKIYIQK